MQVRKQQLELDMEQQTGSKEEKEIEAYEPIPNEGSTFELFADIVQTKTTLDGYDVEWDADDVLYMVTPGNDAWSTAQSFTYADGKFVTESALPEGDYTVNAIYCTESQSAYHNNDGTTHSLPTVQIQNGASTDHIQNYDALVGTFNVSVPMDEAAVVEMAHLYTMMEVDVKNGFGKDVEISKFEMIAEDAVLAGIFNVESFGTPAISSESGASNSIAVYVNDGALASDAEDPFPVYFVMAPLADYSGNVTFKVTTKAGYCFSKTVAVEELTFAAGKYNKTNFTISESNVDSSVYWDMTTDSYVAASASLVSWETDYVGFSLVKGESTTSTNNYLGGINNNAHTRFYKGHVLTFTPSTRYKIESIVIKATSESHASNFVAPEWANASASSEGDVVTVIPTNGFMPVSAVIGTATRATSIMVNYSYHPEYVAPTLESISVEGQQTEFRQGDDFVFGGVVTATYSDESVAVVTASAVFSGYDMDEAGSQTVTVSYTESDVTKTTTYQIEVAALQNEPESLVEATVAEFIAAEVSGTTWYKLTGSIVSIANATYGNFTINDGTGDVYIYGMTNGWVNTNNKSFSEIGLKVGDQVTFGTLRDDYNDTPQGGGNDYPAYYISHIPICHTPVISCSNNTVTITCATDGATIYYSVDEAEYVVYTEPFAIDADCSVSAYAVKDGMLNSSKLLKECAYIEAGSVKTYTLTITKDDFSTKSYADNNKEKISIAVSEDGSELEVAWTSYQIYQSSGAMQWQRSNGYMYNSTDLGNITNVEITATSGTFTTNIGSDAQPSSNGSGGFFKINVGSSSLGKTERIVVTFQK